MGVEFKTVIICDDCTLIRELDSSKIKSYNAAASFARAICGWSVSTNGWYCPDCRKVREQKKYKRQQETRKRDKNTENSLISDYRNSAITEFYMSHDNFDRLEEAEEFIKKHVTEDWLRTKFDKRTLDVLRYRYEMGETYEKIGRRYGITRERIRQLISKAERAIRRFLAYTLSDSDVLQKSENMIN
jgi:RNA polymerase sigma factor (sigma-70 family)